MEFVAIFLVIGKDGNMPSICSSYSNNLFSISALIALMAPILATVLAVIWKKLFVRLFWMKAIALFVLLDILALTIVGGLYDKCMLLGGEGSFADGIFYAFQMLVLVLSTILGVITLLFYRINKLAPFCFSISAIALVTASAWIFSGRMLYQRAWPEQSRDLYSLRRISPNLLLVLHLDFGSNHTSHTTNSRVIALTAQHLRALGEVKYSYSNTQLILWPYVAFLISQDQAYELILNETNFASTKSPPIKGFQAAAQFYLHKNLENVSIADAALLVAIQEAPGLFSPLNNPTKAKRKRDSLINQLVEEALLSEKEAASEIAKPLP